MAGEQTALPLADGQPNGQSSSAPLNPPATGASPPASSTASTTQNSPAPTKTERPGYVPDIHWDATAGKIKDETAFTKFVNDHIAFKAQEDSRRLTLPQKPEDYKLGLPQGFKAPEGIEFVPNENDPLLPQARAFAQKHGLTQDAFHELIALHAAAQIGSQQSIATAKQTEVDKLGPAGTARKTAVDTWLASIDPELGKHFSGFMFTAKQVEFVEKLMAKFRTQGNGSYTPQHQEHDTPGRLTDEQIGKLSFSERLAYAQKFPQPVQNGAGH